MELKKLRKEKKLTQEDVSKVLNIARSTYNGYEQNISEPNIDTLCKLADYYDVSLDYLVGRERNNDIGYLTPKQISAVKLLKLLNEENLIQEIGRLSLLVEMQ